MRIGLFEILVVVITSFCIGRAIGEAIDRKVETSCPCSMAKNHECIPGEK